MNTQVIKQVWKMEKSFYLSLKGKIQKGIDFVKLLKEASKEVHKELLKQTESDQYKEILDIMEDENSSWWGTVNALTIMCIYNGHLETNFWLGIYYIKKWTEVKGFKEGLVYNWNCFKIGLPVDLNYGAYCLAELVLKFWYRKPRVFPVSFKLTGTGTYSGWLGYTGDYITRTEHAKVWYVGGLFKGQLGGIGEEYSAENLFQLQAKLEEAGYENYLATQTN